MQASSIEVWVRMYEEQLRHLRHHEEMRSQSTNIIVAITAASLAFATSGSSENAKDVYVGAFVILLNFYGFLLSMKHNERSRLHASVAGKYRDVISSHLEPSALPSLNEVRKEARSKSLSRHRVFRGLRAYWLWSTLHVLLALCGAFYATSSILGAS